MYWNNFLKFLGITPLLALMLCSKDPGVLQPDPVKNGSITGKIRHPDNNLSVRILSEGGVDSATRNPESQMFTFNTIRYGYCILQVKAEGYGFFEEKFMLDKPFYSCHDIVLTPTPPQVAYLYPSNSQNLDSMYFSMYQSSITDSGFLVYITFNDRMDSASVINAISVLPDMVGVQSELILNISLSVFFPYWKLATTDTVKVSISRKAINQWNDTLACDYNVFFPVDTTYIRTTRLLKK